MKLFWSPASPYARKVRVVARETGLDARIEDVEVATHDDPPELLAANPLGKVPALIGPDGVGWFDSPVICAYLDDLAGGTPLVPRDGSARWAVMRAEALGDGIMDLGLNLVLDTRKPDAERSPTSVARWRGQMTRSLGAVAAAAADLPDGFTLGHITLACAVEYVGFRLPDLDLRAHDPALAAWHATVADRPSLVATAPR